MEMLTVCLRWSKTYDEVDFWLCWLYCDREAVGMEAFLIVLRLFLIAHDHYGVSLVVRPQGDALCGIHADGEDGDQRIHDFVDEVSSVVM
jgi:hypothetical protein